MLFILSGPDGSGKTSVVNELKESEKFKKLLQRFGKKVCYIGNPLPYPWNTEQEILEQRKLYLHLVEKIADGDTVIISDRSPHDLMVYNPLCTEEIITEFNEKLNEIIFTKLILLTCDHNRKPGEKNDYFNQKIYEDTVQAYLKYYAQAYLHINTSDINLEKTTSEVLTFIEHNLLAEEIAKRGFRVLRVGGMPGRGKSTFVDNLVSRLKTSGYNVCHLQEQVGLLLRGNSKSLKRFGLSSLSYDDGTEINRITGSFFPTTETLDQLLLHFDYVIMDFAEYVRGVFTDKSASYSLEIMDKLYKRGDVKNIVAIRELEFTRSDSSRPNLTMDKKYVETVAEIARMLDATLLEDIYLERDSDWVSWFLEFMK